MLKSPNSLREITANFISKKIYSTQANFLTPYHKYQCMSTNIFFSVISKVLSFPIPLILKKKISFIIFIRYERYYRKFYRRSDINFYEYLRGEGNKKSIRDKYIKRLRRVDQKSLKSWRFLKQIDIYYFY